VGRLRGSRSAGVDSRATLAGKEVGVAVMDHPKSSRFPPVPASDPNESPNKENHGRALGRSVVSFPSANVQSSVPWTPGTDRQVRSPY
jgi:hypothetical protein